LRKGKAGNKTESAKQKYTVRIISTKQTTAEQSTTLSFGEPGEVRCQNLRLRRTDELVKFEEQFI